MKVCPPTHPHLPPDTHGDVSGWDTDHTPVNNANWLRVFIPNFQVSLLVMMIFWFCLVYTFDFLFLCFSSYFNFYSDFVLLTVYCVHVFVLIMLLINKIKVKFTQYVLLMYVAKHWLNWKNLLESRSSWNCPIKHLTKTFCLIISAWRNHSSLEYLEVVAELINNRSWWLIW